MAANQNPKRRKKVPGIKLKSTAIGSEADIKALKDASHSLAMMNYADKKRKLSKKQRLALAKKYPKLAHLYLQNLEEQLSGFLAHIPRQYLDKFPGVKPHTDQAAQYYRERSRKAETARHYKPDKYITGKSEEIPKPKG